MKRILQLSLGVIFGITSSAAESLFKDNFARSDLGVSWSTSTQSRNDFRLENKALKIISEKNNPILLSSENKWNNTGLRVKMERQGYASFVIIFHVRFPTFYRLEITEPGKGQVILSKSGADGKIEVLKTAIYKDRINEYNKMDIAINSGDGKIEVMVNDQPVLKFTDDKPYTRGGIGIGGTWFSKFTVYEVEVTPAVSPNNNLPSPATTQAAIPDLFARPEIKDGCFFFAGASPVYVGGERYQ